MSEVNNSLMNDLIAQELVLTSCSTLRQLRLIILVYWVQLELLNWTSYWDALLAYCWTWRHICHLQRIERFFYWPTWDMTFNISFALVTQLCLVTDGQIMLQHQLSFVHPDDPVRVIAGLQALLPHNGWVIHLGWPDKPSIRQRQTPGLGSPSTKLTKA